MKYVPLVITILCVILSFGCDGDGGNSIDSINNCFSLTSSNPCFDRDAVGEISHVDDKSPDEVITEQEEDEDFIRQLNVMEIAKILFYSVFLPPIDPECRWDESAIVINSDEDWNRFRENCFFIDNLWDLPDIDFTKFMVLVSYQNHSGFGTQVDAVLEFGSRLVVVVEDRINDVPAQPPGFPSYIGRIRKIDKVSDVIRVETICNSFFNISNSECVAESLTNSCQFACCSFSGGFTNILKPNCIALDCGTVQCERIFLDNNGEISGTITDLKINDMGQPVGVINIDGEDRLFGCSPLVVD